RGEPARDPAGEGGRGRPRLPDPGHHHQGLRSVVVVGASLAGLRAAEALRRDGFDGSLTILGDEDHQPYDRPPLSKQVLTGTWDEARTVLRRTDDGQIDIRTGVRATGLDVAGHRITLAGGEQVPFDGLVIATGAIPRHLPGTPP